MSQRQQCPDWQGSKLALLSRIWSCWTFLCCLVLDLLRLLQQLLELLGFMHGLMHRDIVLSSRLNPELFQLLVSDKQLGQ